MQFLLCVLAFLVGFIARDMYTESRRKDMVKASNKIFELSSYVVICQLAKMHDYGLSALKMVLEKISEAETEKKEEYEKIVAMFDKKMEEFGNLYMQNLNKALTYKLKYNNYRQVKENFEHLINIE